ncbi:hypothetical protein PIROE2DRAFT_7300 [Piromyces sp. E2]|nr:hypothetical protein PIROE2DRAFT_7300 [Piromyces sp. E2]|eukprot:OUM65634.1 hypothetical protein PIROE2DRAFT_7300 [Piromyces sp. E2]
MLIIIWNQICVSVNVYIPNEKYDLNNLSDLLKYYSVQYKEINIYIDKYYYTSDAQNRGFHILVPGDINVSLIGKPSNGTFIDLTNNPFHFSLSYNEYTGQQFRVENITFYNFMDPRSVEANDIFYFRSYSHNYNFSFKNCVFDTSNSLIFKLDTETLTNKEETTDYQITFDSCQFKNIKGNGVILFGDTKEKKNIINNSVKVINSYFMNCYDIVKMYYGKIEFDNFPFIKNNGNLLK